MEMRKGKKLKTPELLAVPLANGNPDVFFLALATMIPALSVMAI